jgi:hypothetical protein
MTLKRQGKAQTQRSSLVMYDDWRGINDAQRPEWLPPQWFVDQWNTRPGRPFGERYATALDPMVMTCWNLTRSRPPAPGDMVKINGR